MARMIMSVSSSELYPAQKRPPLGSSQRGVLKRVRVVGEEDENRRVGGDEEESEEEIDIRNEKTERGPSRTEIHGGPVTVCLPSTAAHRCNSKGKGEKEVAKSGLVLRPEPVLFEYESRRPLSDGIHSAPPPSPSTTTSSKFPLSLSHQHRRQHQLQTPLPTTTPPNPRPSSSFSSSNPDDTPLSTHRLLLASRTHLHRARTKIARHPRARYIEVPELATSASSIGMRKRGERVLEESGCPKRVMMEGMFPGVGMGGLEGLRGGVQVDSEGGWGGKEGRGRGEGKKVGRIEKSMGVIERREDDGERDGQEGWGGFEIVARRAVED